MGLGLGLQLYDQTTGSSFQGVYSDWIDFAKKHYLKVDQRGRLVSFPLYYDPIEEVSCLFPNEVTGLAAIAITPYVLPQNREFGEFLYRESVRMLGWNDPAKLLHSISPDPRFLVVGLLAARELGEVTTEKRLRDYVERNCEPRWFGEEGAHFGWWFGLQEPYPRGQLSALLRLCEAGEPGAWTRAFQDRGQRERFGQPTVEGIDYPVVGVNQAWNNPDDGVLHVSTFAATPSRRRTPTSFRITQLRQLENVRVYCDGVVYPRWRAIGSNAIEIETEVEERAFRIETRARPAETAPTLPAAAVANSAGPASAATDTTERPYQPAAPTACSCC